MATRSSSPSPTSPSSVMATAVSDCPQCGSVCLGGLLLPCGHLTCRKCLLENHGSQLNCCICQHRLPLPKGKESADFTSLVQQLSSDPVMAQLVSERLSRGQGRQVCQTCDNSENRETTTLCQDCCESFCDSCATMHRRQRATKDHVLQTLPQTLHNVSSAHSSCDSMDSISNPSDESHCSNRWKQWVEREVEMLQAALSKQDAVLAGLADSIACAQNFLAAASHIITETPARQQLLQYYARSLSRLDVTQQDDENTFNVTVTHDDVSLQVKLDSLQQRLRDVTYGHLDASFTSEVRQLIKHLDDVLQGNSRASTQSSSSQTVGLLEAGTAISQVRVSSSFLSSPFITSTVNTPMPPSSAATPTNTVAVSPANTSASTTSTYTPSVDPMTARPRRAFSFTPACDDDTYKPFITSIISTRDGQRLVMTDINNDKVKMVDLHHPHTVSAALTVIEVPWCLALLPDDLVALTTYQQVINLLKITDTVTVASCIITENRYWGVGGLSDGTLVVSCEIKDNNGVARVDIITRDGNLVTTITDTKTLTRLTTPSYLSVVDSQVLLSECVKSAVYKVDIRSGQLMDTFIHPDMRSPFQLTADGSGNVYIAWGESVLARSPGGQWRNLLEASKHCDEGYDRPQGVCLTSDRRLVVAWSKYLSVSVVIAYDL